MRVLASITFILFISSWKPLTLCHAASDGSMATSINGMEKLLEIERALITNLDLYADILQKKVDIIRRAVAEMRAENQKSVEDSESYLSNPINAFSLMRRMYADWITWELYMAESVGAANIKFVEIQREHMPAKEDFDEAVIAIHRLQFTYDLTASDIAAGILNGKKYEANFSSIDCLAIGQKMFEDEDYLEASFWLYTSLQLYNDSDLNVVFKHDHVKILDIYAEALARQGRYEDALTVINVILEANPSLAKYLSRKGEYEWKNKTETTHPPSHAIVGASLYERGCRGEFANESPKLYCIYNTTTSAFLKLAPLKMEIVHLNPYMVLYHDVISDKEIEVLKEMASPQLRRATVYNLGESKSLVKNTRTSKFAWFHDKSNITTIRINQRIRDMTGFDLYGAEMLQVMNYGLGGHYDTHFDFFNVSMTADVVRLQGDRMSTVLFYLNNVEQGGATVFPRLKTAVYPQKGTAVVWYNLNNRGEADGNTLHAACPVIVGSKWVCNKWIRERSQIFTRPCYKE